MLCEVGLLPVLAQPGSVAHLAVEATRQKRQVSQNVNVVVPGEACCELLDRPMGLPLLGQDVFDRVVVAGDSLAGV